MGVTTRVEFIKNRSNDNDDIEHWPSDVPVFRHELASVPPIQVGVQTSPNSTVRVSLDPMNVNVGLVQQQPIPVCIKLCEPICARSNYTIGLDLLCIPLFKVNVQGLTKLYNCASEQTPAPKPNTEPRADSATISGC